MNKNRSFEFIEKLNHNMYYKKFLWLEKNCFGKYILFFFQSENKKIFFSQGLEN